MEMMAEKMVGKINSNKIILDLCGGTGAWSNPYANAGYDVRVITLPKQDVRLWEYQTHVCYSFMCSIELPLQIYGILAAPPCTDFASSGARWWRSKGEKALLESLSIVGACLRMVLLYKPKFWALENPVGRLVHYLGKPKMYFNPCDYSDPYTKKTCLWGNFVNPKKTPVKPIKGSKMHLTKGKLAWKTGETRQELRSITPLGFAQAFFEANR